MPIPVEAGIGCGIVYEGGAGVRRPERKRFDLVPPLEAVAESSSSSSIGENSDGPGVVGAGVDGEEVQSVFNGALESLNALEESLPIRRGISKFYRGKSKSFTSLTDAASSPVKDLGKADNAYSRKRKNLLAHKSIWESSHLLRSTGGGISKRSANPHRSTVAVTVARRNCNNNGEVLCAAHLLPPLNRPGKPACVAPSFGSPVKKCSFSMRSFSMTDLQGTTSSRASMAPADEHKRFS